MKVIVPDFLVERLAPAVRVVAPGAAIVRIDAGPRAGRPAFACLGTFQREPLPPDSPLYDLPNALITPHNSASSPHMEERVIALFLDNLGRLARGEPLLNVVDKQRGY